MKRLANLLRRFAAHLDPPPPPVHQGPTQSLRIQVTAETGAAREALARLSAEMEGLRNVTASAVVEQNNLRAAVARISETCSRCEFITAVRQAMDRREGTRRV